MAITLTTDMILGIGAIIVAAVAIFMFMRATETSKPKHDDTPLDPINVKVEPRKISVPDMPSITKRTQVEVARAQIRTLTVQQEILSMVMKRLFEAEDEGMINKDERERLSKNYEAEMRQVTEQLNKAELIVSLNELEDIRSTIIQQFQETLTDTQSKIDLIIKELNIQPPEPEKSEPETPKPTPARRRRRPVPQQQDEEQEEPEEEGDEEESETRRGRDTVEDRLDKLKQDVLKELEELERLELEQ